MPRVHCLSIGFNATGSLPFIWLNATGPLSLGFIALSWVHCLSHRGSPLLHLPFGAHICLFGSLFAFMDPHSPFGTSQFFRQRKGTSSNKVKFVLWRAYQRFVNWHPIIFATDFGWRNYWMPCHPLWVWLAQLIIEWHAALSDFDRRH